MIDLAPHHKQGLQLRNPIMIGGGYAGYGEALHTGVDPTPLGALVAGPILRYSSGGSELPRVAEGNSGFVLDTGWQNRGVSSVLKRYGPLWSRMGCPIIAQIADSHPELLLGVIEKLNDAFYQGASINGIELHLPADADEKAADMLTTTVLRSTDLPLIVNLPLPFADILADPAAYAGADALVVCRNPQGRLHRRNANIAASPVNSRGEAQLISVSGRSDGQGVFPLMVEKLHQIYEQDLGLPLIGAGGIHSVVQAKQVLESGAEAFQVGSALWVEPGLIQQLVDHFCP